MRRIVWLVVSVAILAGAGAVNAATVPVVRCKTTDVRGKAPGTPSRIQVLASGSTTGLDAYTNGELLLLAPSGMSCSGLISEDGGLSLTVWAHGAKAPAQHSSEAGLTLFEDTACVGCEAGDTCPFLTAFARTLGYPCTDKVPAHEIVSRQSAALALFEDPPGVKGDGWPSGGSDPANGVVGVQGSLLPGPHQRSVYRATCTLPAKEHATCTVSLNDVIARYG